MKKVLKTLKLTREQQRQLRLSILENKAVGGVTWKEFCKDKKEVKAIWGDSVPLFIEEYLKTL